MEAYSSGSDRNLVQDILVAPLNDGRATISQL